MKIKTNDLQSKQVKLHVHISPELVWPSWIHLKMLKICLSATN